MIRPTLAAALLGAGVIRGASMDGNLLKNPDFDFHAFVNHRNGQAENHTGHDVAFWNTDAHGDITVVREAHADPAVRPNRSVRNLVSIAPGKRFWQFFTLPEAGLAPGEAVSLHVAGHQSQPGALKASIRIMRLDREPGTWTPGDSGYADKRTFPRHARGELIAAQDYVASTGQTGAVELAIQGAVIVGGAEGTAGQSVNTVGLAVQFENTSTGGAVSVFSPCLARGAVARSGLPAVRPMSAQYRGIPRTIQKLWKGELVHIMIMGSSIDRGSANPPLYLYNEDPASPDFKKPLGERTFDAAAVNRPDLAGHFGWWNHYFSYGGRLKRELMRKFNLPAERLCLTFMACDGSCVGEAHSGLRDYFTLAMPPGEHTTGHASGTSWETLHPGLFARPQGPAPDLVIFGSGANEKTDTPDEVAVFEGMIRWIQRHHPGTEFLFCQFQNHGGYTPNPGDLMALSLRYQIPFLDFGKRLDDVMRWCDRHTLVPADGHPQAAAHDLWFRQIEEAFACWDPIRPGIAQLALPDRAHPNTYGWEGEMVTFDAPSPRLRNARFIFEDTAVNVWAKHTAPTPKDFTVKVDGRTIPSRAMSFAARDIRNSTMRHGACRLGDRHILEIAASGAELVAVDAKVCPGRRFFPADHALWQRPGPATDFASDWGAPYGNRQVVLAPGQSMAIEAVGTDLSVAYADRPDGGVLTATVDGVIRLNQPTDQPFVDAAGQSGYLENRKGVLQLGFGLHAVRITATNGPVAVLGLFTYDARPNSNHERRQAGLAAGGETIRFSQPFRARPFVLCGPGLTAAGDAIQADRVTFGGAGIGWYEVIGE